MSDEFLQNIQRLYADSEEIRLVLDKYEEISKFYTASLQAMGLLQTVKLGIGNTAESPDVSGSVRTTNK